MIRLLCVDRRWDRQRDIAQRVNIKAQVQARGAKAAMPEQIADGPTRYAARPDLGDVVRICVHGNYLIIFEPYEEGALILRVLHGARNLPGIFGGS